MQSRAVPRSAVVCSSVRNGRAYILPRPGPVGSMAKHLSWETHGELREVDQQRRHDDHGGEEGNRSFEHLLYRSLATDSLDDIQSHPYRGAEQRQLAHQHYEYAEEYRVDASCSDNGEDDGNRADEHRQ